MVFLLLFSNAHAQFDRFFIKPLKQEKSITYGLNNRRTRLFDDNGTIFGGFAGVQFGNNLKHVITINSTVFWIGNEDSHFPEVSEVQLNFIGFSEEYVFWQRNRWNVSSYLHIGVGKASVRPVNESLQSTPYASDWVIPGEAGIQSEHFLNKWLSVRGGFGYRYVFHSNDWPLHGIYAKVGAGIRIKELLVTINQIRRIPDSFSRPCL